MKIRFRFIDTIARRRWLLLTLLLAAALPGSAGQSAAGIAAAEFTVTTLARGMNAPWSLAFLPDGRMLVTEKPGRLRVIEHGALLPAAVSGTPRVASGGQGGLLDVALHPAHAENGWIYLSYAAPGEGGSGTEVMRARLDGQRLVEQQVIFRQQPKVNSSHHFGSRLAFGRDGYLYVTLGERGEREQAQNPDQHLGKIVRLRDDGSVPPDNPFVGRAGARPEIYSLGHRNVQGIAIHPRSGKVWTHEHGPQGGDEINVLRAGANYGWPVITYGVNYFTGSRIGVGTHQAGMEQPLYKWVPSIAPSGMAFYDGTLFPQWQGNLFVGSLKFQTLVRLTLDGERVTGEQRLLSGIGRVRDVRQGPDGALYLIADDKLLRLQPV